MSAADYLHPQLFMTGVELQSALTDSPDRAPMGTMEQMWAGKLRGSRGRTRIGPGTGTGVYKSLREQGWQGPGPGLMHVHEYRDLPEWDKERLSADDMHHRIAAAADMERKGKRTVYIPTWNRTEYPSLKPKGRE